MSEAPAAAIEPPAPAAGGMFEKDKQFGNRLDQLVALHEPFILWAVKVPEGETITTKLGETQVAHLLVERLKDGKPSAMFIDATTIATAIVDKCRAAVDGDLPAVVELRSVDSNFGGKALVLQFVAAFDDPNPLPGGPEWPT